MDDEEGREEGERDYRIHQSRRFSSFVRKRERELHRQFAEQEHSTAADRAISSTKIATWVLAIVGAVALGLGVLQYFVLKGQLDEMKSGSAQTERAITATNALATEAAKSAIEAHRLAQAAVESNDQTRTLVEEARKSAEASSVLAEQAIKSVNAAIAANRLTQQLAGAAVQGNEISTRSLVNVQRAFMSATGLDFEPLPINGQKGMAWRILVAWENSGATPTRDLTIETNCLMASEAVPDPYKIGPDDPYSKSSYKVTTKSAFGPKQKSHIGYCATSFLAAAISMFDENLVQYVAGKATYHDVFDQSRLHTTEFCFALSGVSLEGTGDKTSLSAVQSLCPTHNCADDECEHEREEAKPAVSQQHKKARDVEPAHSAPAPRAKSPG